MLRNLFRLLTSHSKLANVSPQQQIVLYANVDPELCQSKPQGKPATERLKAGQSDSRHTGPRVQTLPVKGSFSHLKPSSSHRARLLSMRVEHIQLCSPHRCARLQELGIVTAGDLASASLERLASRFRAPRRALRVLKEYRRAIRFAASVPGMMPRDAMLLISIHRRSARGLSLESAAMLRRDLDRFAASSQGQAQLRGRRLPSTRRLKRWINECRESSVQSPTHAHGVTIA